MSPDPTVRSHPALPRDLWPWRATSRFLSLPLGLPFPPSSSCRRVPESQGGQPRATGPLSVPIPSLPRPIPVQPYRLAARPSILLSAPPKGVASGPPLGIAMDYEHSESASGVQQQERLHQSEQHKQRQSHRYSRCHAIP